jgi:hypothetical protein
MSFISNSFLISLTFPLTSRMNMAEEDILLTFDPNSKKTGREVSRSLSSVDIDKTLWILSNVLALYVALQHYVD